MKAVILTVASVLVCFVSGFVLVVDTSLSPWRLTLGMSLIILPFAIVGSLCLYFVWSTWYYRGAFPWDIYEKGRRYAEQEAAAEAEKHPGD